MRSVRKYMLLVVIGVSCGVVISLPNQYLRRKGGSSTQMEYWRKRMSEIEDSMSVLGCRKHGNKLK